MNLGNKIKELRTKNGLTQKDLADKLHVTYQAVSRWENDDVEPSIDTLKEMTQVFSCKLDELLGMEETQTNTNEVEQESKPVEQTQVQNVQEEIFGVCSSCGKQITEKDDYCEHSTSHRSGHGRHHHTSHHTSIYCKKCNDARLERQQRMIENKIEADRKYNRKKRIKSYIVGAIVMALFLALGLYYKTQDDCKEAEILFLVSAPFSFTFIGCMMLFNTFIPIMWLSISKWSINFPAIIFSWDLDGFKFLIVMKLLFWVLGAILSILTFLLATTLGFILSPFAYPFAIRNSIKGKELLD